MSDRLEQRQIVVAASKGLSKQQSTAPGDQRQNVREGLPRDCDFGHVERDVADVANDLRPNLDQLLAQAGQRPRLSRFGDRQRAHEIAEVISERVKLQQDGIGGEGAAGREAGVGSHPRSRLCLSSCKD